MKQVHFIGIGGIGVSALARAFLHEGHVVSGSDSSNSDLVEELKHAGITIYTHHAGEQVPDECDLVIRSLAVPKDNEEVSIAQKKGILVQTYPEALSEFSKNYTSIAVSGMHGKSTTTAMLAHVLVAAGLDPTVIVGTKLPLFNNTNFRAGNGKLLLFEADEYGRAILNYYPDIAIVLNTDKEHLDIYSGIEDVHNTFAEFTTHVPENGHLVLNKNDDISAIVQSRAKANICFFDYPQEDWNLSVPGRHNQLNAEAAWQVAELLGVGRGVAKKSLEEFCGAWRRMERLEITNKTWNFQQAVVYSDYAHHPVEIEATIQAFRERYPKERLLIIYQPHQIERLTKLFEEFTRAFDGADEVWLVPTYEVSGREYEGKKRTSEELASYISSAHYFYDMDDIFTHLNRLREPQDTCIVFMGAGDIDEKMRIRI